MNDAEVLTRLERMVIAAMAQGQHPYDHSACLDAAEIAERGDALFPVLKAWLKALPEGYPTLGHWMDAKKPTGLEAGQVFSHAADMLIREIEGA